MTTTMPVVTLVRLEDCSDALNEDMLDYVALRVLNDAATLEPADARDHVRAVRAATLVRRTEIRELQDFRVVAISAFYEDQRRASLAAPTLPVGEVPPASSTGSPTGRHSVRPFARGAFEVLDADGRPAAISATEDDAWTVAGLLDTEHEARA